jgi:hypothetical protein
MTTYTEPFYPIHKIEHFDEENMKHLLTDELFNRGDRTRLSAYNKHRTSGSSVSVLYKLAAGCEEHKLGRIFPVDGLGLQAFRFDMRNPLAYKFYWDIDIENAHYVFAEKFADKYDLDHEHITYYIDHRNECLELVSNTRKKAKTEFLKVLYGGDITLYNDKYTEVDGDIKQEGLSFLHKLKKEVNELMYAVWEQHSHLHKIKVGKDKIPMHKKPNCKASLMSLLLQTEERKVLMYLDHLLSERGRKMAVFIHDGGYIEKLNSSEKEFPPEIMEECSRLITEKFKYRVKITQKPITYDWKPSNPRLTEYEERKKEFEKNHCMIGSRIASIQLDNTLEFYKVADMRNRQLNNHYMVYNEEKEKKEQKYFFDEWMRDPNRLTYDRADFIPDKSKCSPKIYNLFRGFNAEKMECDVDEEQKKNVIERIKKHLDDLTSGYSEWLLKWMANIIQHPMNKSEQGVLLRDQSNLLKQGGGSGKNLFIDWFACEVIGEEYYHAVDDNSEIYREFNAQFQGKLLVTVNEADSKDNHANNDFLKAKITSKKTSVNKKGIDVYTTRDYTNYIFCSNNTNPIPIKLSDRRFVAFDVRSSHRGDNEYFTDLHNMLYTKEAKWCFYKYLKDEVETYKTPIEFQVYRPITPCYKNLIRLNAPVPNKWIISLLYEGCLSNKSIDTLYKDFRKWCKDNREGEESNMSLTKFGCLLGNDLSFVGTKRRTNQCVLMEWNVDALITNFKNQYLLNDDFIYTPCEVDFINDDEENDVLDS